MAAEVEMSQPEIVQLPYLCLKEIFDQLALKDLAGCRAVCRLFKFYVDQTAVHKLAVGQTLRYTDECYDNWYLTDRSLYEACKDSISLKAFSSLSPSQFELDQQLTFLYIRLDTRCACSNLELVNNFQQLVHLEVNWDVCKGRLGRIELILPELRVLSIRNSIHRPLILKTRKLEVLLNDRIEAVVFEWPESIKKLDSNYPNAATMAKFVNIESFRCEWISGPPDPELLTVWKHLKELNFDQDWTDAEPEYNEMRSFLVQLLSRKRTLRREKLQVYLSQVRLLDANQLENYEATLSIGDEAISMFQLKNFRLLRPDAKVDLCCANYNDLMSLFDGQLSSDFFDRFNSFEAVEATGAVDPDHFEWFLKNVNSLKLILTPGASLGQAFLDKLPSINDQFTKLTIRKSSVSTTNFDFVFQLPKLNSFSTDQQLERPLDWTAKLFERKKAFYEFEFRIGRYQRARITRTVGGFVLKFSEIENNDESSDEDEEIDAGEMNEEWTSDEDMDEETSEDEEMDEEDSRKEAERVSKELDKPQIFCDLTWTELEILCEQRKRELAMKEAGRT